MIPMVAMIMICFRVPALDPMAEFRKLTASLLTPTMRSVMAIRNMMTTIKIKTDSI
jgi:hypothetical protein